MIKNFYHKEWDCYIGKKVKIISSSKRYSDLKGDETGEWKYKDVEIGMCAIVLNGEKNARLFHIFDYVFI